MVIVSLTEKILTFVGFFGLLFSRLACFSFVLITLSLKSLKNLCLEGRVAPTLRPTPLSQQESGHPTPRREHTKQRGRAEW